jgi:hypothetical protein
MQLIPQILLAKLHISKANWKLIYRIILSLFGISELGSATTKTDTAKRGISIGSESLQVCFGNRNHGILEGFTARWQS